MTPQKGLTTEEAKRRLSQFGPNELRDTHKITAFDVLWRQIQGNFIIYLLTVAALMSFFVGKNITGVMILVVIFVVVTVGFIQEYKAEQALSALKKMIMPVSLALRNGKKVEVESRYIVPGDIVFLRSGEKIPADCLLLESRDLRVNESILTGESIEVKKNAVPADGEPTDENRLFMGTFIVNGKAIVSVEHTGMNTKFGEIAGMISETEKELPLRDKINTITKFMVIVAIIFSFVTGLLILLRAPYVDSAVLVDVLIIIIAMSVSSFPEGFPVVLVSTLAVGASRMAKHNAIVNRMSIIETLGETTVICTDKTGTITTGEMTIRNVYVHPGLYDVTGVGFEGNGDIQRDEVRVDYTHDPVLEKLITCGIVCNDSAINRTGEDNEFEILGTPTEAALLVLGAKVDLYREDLEYAVIEELPFNSERKMMSVLVEKGQERTIFAKGAPEVLIETCSHIYVDGTATPLTSNVKKDILAFNETQTSNALRTLALAFKPAHKDANTYKEEDLIFLGIVSMEDPPRIGVKEALEVTRQSGIKVKLITGDNKTTAQAIAEEVGIKGSLLEGYQLEEMSDEELKTLVPQTAIFARVKPQHKLRIVRALKENDEIVAMTGDGVNDAPALKEAHIGIAMGKNGTDVSRSVSDLILKDDNFSTIVDAIREGRTIFTNLRKFTSYQLSCNGAEMLILLISTIFAPYVGWQVPVMLALQILFMNLVTDNLPAIALGFNPSSKDIMDQKPRKGADILTRGLKILTVKTSIIMATITLSVYVISFNVLGMDTVTGRTTGLFALIMMEIFGAYNFRSFRKKVLTRSPWVNQYLFAASVLSLLLTFVIIYTPMNVVFETVPLSGISLLLGLASGLVLTLLYDIIKAGRGVLVRDA